MEYFKCECGSFEFYEDNKHVFRMCSNCNQIYKDEEIMKLDDTNTNKANTVKFNKLIV